MNKNIKLAVAGAVLALSATANAGIIIPAGDWTVDLSGNVNAFMSTTRNTGDNAVAGGLAMPNNTTTKNANTISTGDVTAKALSVSSPAVTTKHTTEQQQQVLQEH